MQLSMQICVLFAVHNGDMLCLEVQTSNKNRAGLFPGFQRMQSGMVMILCNTSFGYCNFNIPIYIYSRMKHIAKHFSVWSFVLENQNFNHSLWLILYSNTLDFKSMKHSACSLLRFGIAWNRLREHYAVIVIQLSWMRLNLDFERNFENMNKPGRLEGVFQVLQWGNISQASYAESAHVTCTAPLAIYGGLQPVRLI